MVFTSYFLFLLLVIFIGWILYLSLTFLYSQLFVEKYGKRIIVSKIDHPQSKKKICDDFIIHENIISHKDMADILGTNFLSSFYTLDKEDYPLLSHIFWKIVFGANKRVALNPGWIKNLAIYFNINYKKFLFYILCKHCRFLVKYPDIGEVYIFAENIFYRMNIADVVLTIEDYILITGDGNINVFYEWASEIDHL